MYAEYMRLAFQLGATVCVPDKAPLCKQCPVSTHCIAYREGVTQWEMTAVAAVTPEADACDVCLPVPADAVRTLGPVYYPVKIKTNKVRDEAVAVCIVERSNGGETEYLMVQRPDKGRSVWGLDMLNRDSPAIFYFIGLLAGMWEFPSVIVATTPPSEDGTLPPVPELDHLSKAMDTYFLDVLQFSEQVLVGSKRKSLGSLVHVFSHIRQTYFVEHLAVGDGEIKVLDTGISMKWMAATTMKDEAVPSGQCKIFALLGGKGSGASATSKKRKAEAEVATKSVRPITAFFKPKEKK